MSEQKMREALEEIKALTEIPFAHTAGDHELIYQIATEALAQPAATDSQVTVLPDGSAFGLMSFPLPADHWLYAPREYSEGADEPQDLPQPILTHALRAQVVDAVRYAVRGATMCGKENDFDPDALVQNAVYALCGPFSSIERAREDITRQPVDYPDLRDALEDMVAAFGGGGIEVPLSERVAALDKACKALAGQPAAEVELTDAELEAGRHQVFSTNNPFCPCDSKTFRKAARWAISAHEAKKNGGGA